MGFPPFPPTFWRSAWRLLWGLWLALLCGAAYAAMAGHSAGGPMNIDPAPFLLLLLGLPTGLLSPWLGRDPVAANLHRLAAAILALVTLWWQFWLPAVLRDEAYSLRYDIPAPAIWPAEAPVPLVAIGLAVWLATPTQAWRGWQAVGHVALWLGLTAAAVALSLEGPTALEPPWAGVCLLSAAALLPASRRLPWPRWLSLWLAAHLTLLAFWGAIYAWGDQLPAAFNAWGYGLIHRL